LPFYPRKFQKWRKIKEWEKNKEKSKKIVDTFLGKHGKSVIPNCSPCEDSEVELR
jgi:hypothetical protein